MTSEGTWAAVDWPAVEPSNIGVYHPLDLTR